MADTTGPTARAWPILAVLFGLFTIARALAGKIVEGPIVFNDELIYWQAARSFHESGSFVFMGNVLDLPAVLYSVILSPIFALPDPWASYAVAKWIGAALVSLVVFPAYAIARQVVPRAEAWAVALLAAAAPGAAYSATIMVENLFYPVFATGFWLAYLTIRDGRLIHAVGAAILFIVGYYTKATAGILVLAYALTLAPWALVAVGQRRDRLVRELLVRAVPLLAFASLFLWRIFAAATANSASSAAIGSLYAETLSAAAATTPWARLQPVLPLLLLLFCVTLWRPGVSLLLAVRTLPRERPARRWFTVFVAANVIAFVGVISHFIVAWDVPGRTFERYVFVLWPPLLALHFAIRRRYRTRNLRATLAVTAVVFAIGFAVAWPAILAGNRSADSPTLTTIALASHLTGTTSYGLAAFLIWSLTAAVADATLRRPWKLAVAWCLLLLVANAGWYGWQHQASESVREMTKLPRAILAQPGTGGRVLVLTDDLPRDLVSTTAFWLPGGVALVDLASLREVGQLTDEIRLLVAARSPEFALPIAAELYDGKVRIYRNPTFRAASP